MSEFQQEIQIRLDTATRSLEEAQRLYRSAGYRKVAPFNDDPYADLWFERTLGN